MLQIVTLGPARVLAMPHTTQDMEFERPYHQGFLSLEAVY